MNIPDMLLVMTQKSEVEDPTLFPFPFSLHLIFACIGVVFFAFRFATQKRPYQAVIGAAILIFMAIWLSPNNKPLFYTLGIIVTLLLIVALVLYIVIKPDAEKSSDGNNSGSADAVAEAAGNATEETASEAVDDLSGNDEEPEKADTED